MDNFVVSQKRVGPVVEIIDEFGAIDRPPPPTGLSQTKKQRSLPLCHDHTLCNFKKNDNLPNLCCFTTAKHL